MMGEDFWLIFYSVLIKSSEGSSQEISFLTPTYVQEQAIGRNATGQRGTPTSRKRSPSSTPLDDGFRCSSTDAGDLVHLGLDQTMPTPQPRYNGSQSTIFERLYVHVYIKLNQFKMLIFSYTDSINYLDSRKFILYFIFISVRGIIYQKKNTVIYYYIINNDT